MVDVFDRAKRSEVMAKIRGRGNRSTELAVASVFRSAHVTGWRRHLAITCRIQPPLGSAGTGKARVMRVRPDFVFPSARLAIFVDGCFWHACPLHSKMPENNRSFWEAKLQANVARDRRANRLLRRAGWSVLRIWEHELRDPKSFVRRVKRRLQRLSRRVASLRG